MSQSLDADEASSLVASGVAAAARVFAGVCIVFSAFAVLVHEAAGGDSVVGFVGVAALFGMAVLILWPRWRPAAAISALYILLGGVAIVCSVLCAVSSSVQTNTDLLILTGVAVILVGAVHRQTAPAIGWMILGLLVAEIAAFVARVATDQTPTIDVPLLLLFATTTTGVFLVAARSGRREHRMRVSLHAATREDEMSYVRRAMELQATAFMHDTVLGHLAAISAAEPGILTEHARTQMLRDIALLLERHWLISETDEHDPALGRWEQSPIREAIAEVHSPTFSVVVSGDLGAMERVSAEQENAFALATKQSLVNTREHAGTSTAEVVLLATKDAVTVMVIDDGVGFDPEQTPVDRLGVSHSIRRRVEMVGGTVSIWSSPGSGTSVVMSVPVEGYREAVARQPRPGLIEPEHGSSR